MPKAAKARSMSIRMDDALWRDVESAIRVVENTYGVTLSMNAMLVACIRDGLALREKASGSACLPGWFYDNDCRDWRRTSGNYLLMVNPSSTANGPTWEWCVVLDDHNLDEPVTLREEEGLSSAIGAMVAAELAFQAVVHGAT